MWAAMHFDEDDTRPLHRRPRAALNASVIVTEGDKTATLTLFNLSEGGAFVVTPAPPPVGTRIRLEVAAG